MLALRHIFSGIQWLISATVRMYADHLNLCFNKMVTSIYINEYVCTLFELTRQPNKCENRFMETNRCTYWFCIAWIVSVNWEMNYFMWKINLTWEIEKKICVYELLNSVFEVFCRVQWIFCHANPFGMGCVSACVVTFFIYFLYIWQLENIFWSKMNWLELAS